VPTWLVKRASDALAPVLSEICNALLQSGDLPETQKSALVFPRIKKLTLDAEDANSYQPISNLSFTSKFVGRIFATRFTARAERHRLFPSNQSAYRRHHNTETAVVSVMNDIIRAMDRGEVAALVLLDLYNQHEIVTDRTLSIYALASLYINNVGKIEQGFACILKSTFTTALTCERR